MKGEGETERERMSEEALALSPLLLFPSLTCLLVRPSESLS